MVFPTLNFLLFYLVVWPLSWAAVWAGRHKLHKLILVAASLVFYSCWDTRLMAVLIASIVFNWFFGHVVYHYRTIPAGRLWVLFAVGANVAVLGYFKYFNFFLENLNYTLTMFGLEREVAYLEILLPLGISFFTFQGISYVVDLYRGDLDRPRPLLDVMVFISFFAHLVAGPIVRASKFMPQLEAPPNPKRVFVGMSVLLILWGVFKKAVIANWLAINIVDNVFRTPSAYGGFDLLLGVYGYAVQIYCDFSAYSDIAIGVAALLGYRFQRNFNQPYRAASLQDFWRRWHITLSTWLRDYLYIPLGGSRHGRFRTRVNLLATMLVGGFWHGASFQFVIWGALHGTALVLERLVLEKIGSRRPTFSLFWRGIAIFAVFHFVCLCWIFFRAKDLATVGELLVGLGDWSQPTQLATPFIVALLAIGFVMHFVPPDLIQRADRLYAKLPTWGAGLLCGVFLIAIEVLGGDGSAPFIYFQF